MKRCLIFLAVLMLHSGVFANALELDGAIENVRNVCGGLSAELHHMKTMAGINTAVTVVGTVAGGVALGTGIAKASVDKRAEQAEQLVAKLREKAKTQDLSDIEIINWNDVPEFDAGTAVVAKEIDKAQQELDELTKKSKNLGNWRTGTMAAATATNIAGTVIAATNRVKGDLKTQIANCLSNVKVLQNVRMQARMAGDADADQLARAEKIVSKCGAWEMVNVDSINTRSTGAAVSSGVGAAMGLAGTITSATANSNKVRDDNTETGKAHEKNLNTASNVLAGGTAVASGVATVFNATQIGAIKRAAKVADECDEVLR